LFRSTHSSTIPLTVNHDSPHFAAMRQMWSESETTQLIAIVRDMAGQPPAAITAQLCAKLQRSLFSVSGRIARLQHDRDIDPAIRELLSLHVRRLRKNGDRQPNRFAAAPLQEIREQPQPTAPRIEVAPIHSFATCQFLTGDPRKRIFCGNPVEHPTVAYCRKHRLICLPKWSLGSDKNQQIASEHPR